MLVRITLSISLFAAFCSAGWSGDWPQILGPQRDGIARDERLNLKWPQGKPPLMWQANIGSGFAGPAIAGDRVYFHHREAGTERALCYNADTGDVIWEWKFTSNYVPTVTYDDGPRCVPTVLADRVIFYSPAGVLRCLDRSSGEPVWNVSTHEKYGAQEGYFGAGSSPLVVGDRIIVNVGGSRAQAGIVAFALKDGTELWKNTDEQASYSSPIVRTIDGTTHVLIITRMQALSLNPADGSVRFSIPFGKRGPTVNAANPVVIENSLFLTASYGVGAIYAQIGKNKLDEFWASDELLSSQYSTPVVHQGLLFGVHGRQDIGQPVLRCLDPQAKAIKWEKPLDSYANLILAGDTLLVSTVDGELIAVKATGSRFTELARARLTEPTPRGAALPALSDGRLVLRDMKTLRSFKLGP